MIDESFFVFNLKTNGHCVSIIDDTGDLSSRVAVAVEWNAVEFVAVSVKKVDEVGHDFLSFSLGYIQLYPPHPEKSNGSLRFVS